MKQSIALIGPGLVGCAVSKRLHQAGYPLTAIISRSIERAVEACTYIGCTTELASDQLASAATAQIILLAVPDDQIRHLALKLQTTENLSHQTTLVHFSGLHPAKIMCQEFSAATLLSLHPLLPFADRQRGFTNLHKCPCVVEGDNQPALVLGQQLVNAIGGLYFTVDSDKKALYHTAACLASNYLVTLLASARDLLVACDIPTDQVIPLLLPLVQASLDNVKEFGPEQGLTGPIVRGDSGTIAVHIRALKTTAPELLPLYLQMGELTSTIAVKSGRITPDNIITIRSLFSKAFRNQAGLSFNDNLSEKNN